MPNQLIQKPRKEKNNLCLTCIKSNQCQDYKVLKYVDVCDDYVVLNKPKCFNNAKKYYEMYGAIGDPLICKKCKLDEDCETYLAINVIETCANCIKLNRCNLNIVYDKHGCCAGYQSLKNKNCNSCSKNSSCLDNAKRHFNRNGGCLGYESIEKVYCKTENKPIEVKVTLTTSKTLIENLQDAKFEKGIKVYNSLKEEYDNVTLLLNSRENINSTLIDLEKITKVTNEIYNKSQKFLLLALNIFKQLNVTSYDNLKVETEESKENLSSCKPESALYKTLTEVVDKNNKMLDLMKKNKDRIDELFGQVSLCKDAIMEIRLGLPELLHHQSTDELNKTITESKDRLNFAQRLLEEYKIQGL